MVLVDAKVAVMIVLCANCDAEDFPPEFFADVPVSEGHLDSRFGDTVHTGVRSVSFQDIDLDLNTVLACRGGDDGWVVCDWEFGGGANRCPRCGICFLHKLGRGRVSVSRVIPGEPADRSPHARLGD